MRSAVLILVLAFANLGWADTVAPTRTIRAKQIIQVEDITLQPGEISGMAHDPVEVIGKEARVALYPGRPIRNSDIGLPAVVDRNELVTIVFVRGSLSIAAEGRALGRGAVGEFIRVMNLSSRTTLNGLIRADGKIEVK